MAVRASHGRRAAAAEFDASARHLQAGPQGVILGFVEAARAGTVKVGDHLRQQLVEKLDKYTLLERIGKGAMGAVYRAWDDSLGEVAIKIMSADLNADHHARERFMREARVAAALDHPNIIDIHGMGEFEGRPYIVMELLDGENFKALIRQGDLVPLERRLELMQQVVGALAYAHRAGIAHRDIKPENVFVTRGGNVRILDFGVARVQDSTMTATGVVLGTPAYMSPEQVAGNKVDRRSDVFSVGVVFYELLTGQRAFRGRVDDVFDKVMHEQPAPIHSVDERLPKELSAIIAKAMSKEPVLRYQSMDEMQLHLQLFERSLPRLRQKARSEAVAAIEALDAIPAGGIGPGGVRSVAELPEDYLGLTGFVRGLTDGGDQLDDLIEELLWVAETNAAALDAHGVDTLRRMANRVDDIREVWPDEPTVTQLARRLLDELRARMQVPRELLTDPTASLSGEFGRPV
jgi:predicted Ser/Thr protein kinase